MPDVHVSKFATTAGIAAASLTFTTINASRAITSESVGFGTKIIGIVLKEGTRIIAGDIPAEIVDAATKIVTANTKNTINTGMFITATASAAVVCVGTVIIVSSAELLAIAASNSVYKLIRYINKPKKIDEIECDYEIEEIDNDYEIINIYYTPEEYTDQCLEDVVLV